MTNFSETSVLVVCSCNSLRPITKLYFCRHCIELRCGYCINSEVDGIFCSSCCENLATSEAKLKKNRCGSCFQCPSCFHALTVRGTVTKLPVTGTGTETTLTPKSIKSYYLCCYFCQWSSRDAKIPDQQTQSSSNWAEHKNIDASRIASLIEYYDAIVNRERLQQKKLFNLPRRGYQHFLEKYGITGMIARKRAGLPHLGISREESNLPEITQSIASEEVDPLPADIFTKPVDTSSITTLKHRYVLPDLQPESMDQIFPAHKQLFSKRALRCKNCSHFLFKPEYSPGSIKFKIYLAAYYLVPEIKLMKKYSFVPGVKTEVLVKLCNPAQSSTTIKLSKVENLEYIEEANCGYDNNFKQDLNNEPNSLSKGPTKSFTIAKMRTINTNMSTGVVELSDNVTINLPPRDDTAEFDDVIIDNNQYKEDSELVIWRKANKVALKLTVTPDSDLKMGDDVRVPIGMRFTYNDKISAVEQKQPARLVDVHIKYILNVGSIENTV